MEVTSFNVNITSEYPERLQAFYRDMLGLPAVKDMGQGALVAAGAPFLIDGDSDTSGDSKEPQRLLLNFFVGDRAAEQVRLEAEGVKCIRPADTEYWGGVISTFVDPDGNYAQLIEFKPE